MAMHIACYPPLLLWRGFARLGAFHLNLNGDLSMAVPAIDSQIEMAGSDDGCVEIGRGVHGWFFKVEFGDQGTGGSSR